MFFPFNKHSKDRRNKRTSGIIVEVLFLTVLVAGMFACQENDDVPPVITLIGEDTLTHVLNSEYIDPGATAQDDTEGDLTSNIFVDNNVDEDRVGEYTVRYRVVDDAGNEAPEISRIVYVFNEAEVYQGDYMASEMQVFPSSGTCTYPVFLWQDSTVNNRILFFDFACGIQREVYADIQNALLELPLQLIEDSVIVMSVQGFGSINDSLAYLEYTRTDSTGTELWQATYTRVK